MKRVGPLTRFCVAAGLSVGLIAAAAGGADARSRKQCLQKWNAHLVDFKMQGISRHSFLQYCLAKKGPRTQ